MGAFEGRAAAAADISQLSGAGRASSAAPGLDPGLAHGRAVPAAAAKPSGPSAPTAPLPAETGPFVRAENEDDDGYDPYSDRPAPLEPLFERDPWG